MELCHSSLHQLIHPLKRSDAPANPRERFNLGGLQHEWTTESLPAQLVCSLLREIVSGMLFLHGTMGIQHGDLKPRNILVKIGEDGECTLKLCDFGSSRMLQLPPTELAFTGTLPYMAPELLDPSSTPDAGSADTAARAVDVYSFGVCLWEALTRQFPWRHLLEQGMVIDLKRRVAVAVERPPTDTIRIRAESPVDGPIGKAEAVPRALLLLLEACWRHDPAARPTFAQLAQLDLERLCFSMPAEEQLVQLIDRTEREAASLPNRTPRSSPQWGIAGSQARAADELPVVPAGYQSPAMVVPPQHSY